MEFIIKFAQAHESFRVAEIKSLAIIEGIDLEILGYSDEVCPTTFASKKGSTLCSNADINIVPILPGTTTIYQ